jgi:hypothetical protein
MPKHNTPVITNRLGMVFTIPAHLYRDLHNIVTGCPQLHAKKSCTVTIFWLKYQDRARMLCQVTQPSFIAVLLCVRYRLC